MAHRTRSGRVFRRNADWKQPTPSAEASEALLVLTNYLDLSNVLTGRLVCEGWRKTFGTAVKQLQLQQPGSARATLALGLKAAAAFSKASVVRLKLMEVKDPAIDLTADDADAEPELFGPEGQGKPAASAVLLSQLSKGLQQLHLVAGVSQTCTCLPALLSAAPQLIVLDLSCCAHRPDDLLVLAQHAPGLQELLLHCQAFTTLSGRRIRHGNPEWGRHGGNARYQPQHIAALAQLPQLQLLEVPLPSTRADFEKVHEWFEALGSLSSLTSLHVIRHGKCNSRSPAAALTALSRLKQLKELRCEAGHPTVHGLAGRSETQQVQAECWGAVLPCMPQLTRLEFVDAIVGDELLCTIGRSATQLQRLVFDTECWSSRSSQAGADAIAHVGHIELLAVKDFRCSRNVQLLQLPGIKRVECPWSRLLLEGPIEGPVGDMAGANIDLDE